MKSHGQALEQKCCFPGVLCDGGDLSADLLSQLYGHVMPCYHCLNSKQVGDGCWHCWLACHTCQSCFVLPCQLLHLTWLQSCPHVSLYRCLVLLHPRSRVIIRYEYYYSAVSHTTLRALNNEKKYVRVTSQTLQYVETAAFSVAAWNRWVMAM